MPISTSGRRAIFALAAATILALAIAVVHSRIAARNPEVLGWALTFDLTLTIPLLYYAIVVRGGHARPVTLVPVFVICVGVAAHVVPSGQQQFLHQLRWVAAPLDVLTLWLLGRRLVRGTSGSTALDRLIASEITVLSYALTSWRKRPEPGFTVHQRSAWGSVVAAIIIVIAAESIGMHLLVQMWSVRAAWIVTALDLYGILWLLGDYQALRLRPTTIDSGSLHIRYGIRWSADVALDNIASVEPVRGEWKRPGALKIAILDDPALLIRLREPVTATGLGGLLTRQVDTIAILPDDIDGFKSALGSGLTP